MMKSDYLNDLIIKTSMLLRSPSYFYCKSLTSKEIKIRVLIILMILSAKIN